MRNWAELLHDMLYSICDSVVSLKELVAFGGVCSTWRRVAVEKNLGKPLLPFPWLMLAENQDNDFRDFYSVTEGKSCSFKLPELRGKMCMETKGWIVTVSKNGEMALVHPLTHVQIPLPHQNTSKINDDRVNPLYNVKKAVLSSPYDPKNERDCVLAILHGVYGHVEFCRPGDKVWAIAKKNFNGGIQALEYYRGKFFAVTNSGWVWEYDVFGNSIDVVPVSPRRIGVNIAEHLIHRQSYLVASAGSLLVVTRSNVQYMAHGPPKFQVFEIDVEQEEYRKITSLGTRAIFVGHSASLSIDTIWYPELIPNSIYFTDDCYEAYRSMPEGGGKNMGVYELENGSIQTHYSGKSLSLVCPPVWTFITRITMV